MQKIIFCKKCLNPSTRPNTFFDENGYCYVCIYEKNKQINLITNKKIWERKKREISKICEWAKKKKKSTYDCIIPVSGGKDSYRQSFYVRDVLGLNPLLVSNNYPPEQWTDIGALNLQNLVNNGFDIINISLDPIFWKKLYRHCFKRHGNMMKASEMALFSAPVHIALEFEIPLMFYGENPAHTIGEKHGGLTGDASGIKYGNTIKGGPNTLNFYDNDISDFYFYEYPTNKSLKASDIKIIYLGYYIRNWYGYINGKKAIKKGFKIRKDIPNNTGDLWGFTGVDDNIRLVNQFLKYLKFGYGHVVDQVCEAINQKIMTRQEGIKLINKYDGKCSKKYILAFCKYSELSLKEFWLYVDKIVNKELFEKKNGKWIKKFKVY